MVFYISFFFLINFSLLASQRLYENYDNEESKFVVSSDISVIGDYSPVNAEKTNNSTVREFKAESKKVLEFKKQKYSVFFELDSHELSRKEKKKLTLLTKLFSGNLKVTGFTCDIGTENRNEILALNRSLEVKNFLNSKGIKNVEIIAKPQCCYISEDKSKNRRAEIEF